MNLKKRIFTVIAALTILSLGTATQASAADIAVNLNTDYDVLFLTGVQGATSPDQYIVSSGTGVVIRVDDCCIVGDMYEVRANGNSLGITSTVVLNGPTLSTGTFSLFPGSNTVTLIHTAAPVGAALTTIRFSLSNTWQNPAPSPKILLRLDAQGTTTEKSNVVTCTPGKYTFLNGGATPETAKVQSFVYTLLVNGKAVSTLSSDGFKTVAPHLFPTIAGNLAGTATLDGATWDLKGMSNYSAQCQIYATQSGGNIQSVTTAASDSVALAAAAEAAAAAQRTKDLIADWTATNADLVKKYRDQRLAGKP